MLQKEFTDIIILIQQARATAVKAVNTELINLYWNVGAYISKRIASAKWGDKTVDELAGFIQKNHPELKGFNRRGVYRMVQFYDTYAASAFVAPVLRQIQIIENEDNIIVPSGRTQLDEESKLVSSAGTQLQISDIRESILVKISWTHNRTIISRCKTAEEREFYLRLIIKENRT